MICPRCGKDGKSRVLRTIECSDGIVRERVCLECGAYKLLSTERYDEMQKKIDQKT